MGGDGPATSWEAEGRGAAYGIQHLRCCQTGTPIPTLLSVEVTWRNMMKKCRIQTTRREFDAGDYTAELMAEKEEVPFVDPTPPADGYHGRR